SDRKTSNFHRPEITSIADSTGQVAAASEKVGFRCSFAMLGALWRRLRRGALMVSAIICHSWLMLQTRPKNLSSLAWLDRTEYPFTSRYFQMPSGPNQYVHAGRAGTII